MSLLNVNIKIASKVLAVRVQSVTNNLIEYNQTANVPGRFIGESIRLIDDILE